MSRRDCWHRPGQAFLFVRLRWEVVRVSSSSFPSVRSMGVSIFTDHAMPPPRPVLAPARLPRERPELFRPPSCPSAPPIPPARSTRRSPPVTAGHGLEPVFWVLVWPLRGESGRWTQGPRASCLSFSVPTPRSKVGRVGALSVVRGLNMLTSLPLARPAPGPPSCPGCLLPSSPALEGLAPRLLPRDSGKTGLVRSLRGSGLLLRMGPRPIHSRMLLDPQVFPHTVPWRRHGP